MTQLKYTDLLLTKYQLQIYRLKFASSSLGL